MSNINQLIIIIDKVIFCFQWLMPVLLCETRFVALFNP